MESWALIINGVVHQVDTISPVGRFPPDMVWAACPSTVLPGYTYDGTNFAAPAAAPAPTLAQQAAALLDSGGLTISSTSTPALDGTYSVAAIAVQRLLGVSHYATINGKFPGGAATYTWYDASGGEHVFTDIALFQEFFTALADYESALTFLSLGAPGVLPATSATIS